MPRSRIPSPARSQGVISTPRRDKLRRRTRSVCSPAQCNFPVRLSSLVSESYKLSPMPNRQSVLTDETDIEIPPGRQSWWKKLGDDDSRDVMDVLGTKDMAEIKNLANEFDVEVLSQEKKNYTLDLPESSDSESITSIIIPQQKLFAQKDHNHQKDFAQIQNSRDSQSNKHKSHVHKDLKVAPKNLFSLPSKPRNRPMFPAALLNISTNKTMNKTKEMTIAEVEVQVRSLFGNRPGTKRKNMFADFIVSDSEEDIPDIQPKVFGFQNNVNKKRRESSTSRASRHSPTSSIDLELDDWKLLPSSTMLGNQLEDTTPVKQARLSKLSEVKESVTVSTINKTMNKTKQSNKSINAKNKSKISSNSKLVAESSKLQDDNLNILQSNDQGTNSSTSRLTRNKSKSIRETSLTEANRSKNINKSKNIRNQDQSIVNKVDDNQVNINLLQDGDNLQNELLDEGEDNADFTLEYENDDEQNMECVDNIPNNSTQSKSSNNTLKQTSIENILDKENKNVQESTYDRQESTNKSQQINKNMDIDMLDGNATKESVQLNDKQEIQNLNNDKLDEIKNKTNVSIHNTSKKHNESKQNKVGTENEVNQESHNNTRNQIEIEKSQNKSNYVSQEIGQEGKNHDQSNAISKVNEEENVNSEQKSTEENGEENESNEQNNTKENSEQNNTEEKSEQNNTEENDEIVSNIEDQNESREALDESDQIDLEQEQNETEEQEEMEEDNQELNQSDEGEEDDSDTAQQDDEGVTSNNEEENEENEEQDDENENEDEKIEDQDEENEEQVMEYDQDVENEEEEEEDDEEQDTENDQQESNESEVESNVDDSEQVDHDGPIEEENDNEDGEVSGNKNDESPNITHDTTGKYKNIQKVTSPEAILHDKTNQIVSFMAEGRNTSVRKTKSIIKTLSIRPSLAPARESTGLSDGTRNSSADNSGWDSHRTTRKTLRQTFGKDFTPRKSLRALVMEKSAKRHTNFVEKEADLAENGDNKIPQANSTELPHFDSYVDPEPVHVDETAISTVEESNHEEHDMSKRTRQTTLEMYLEKIKRDNLERRRRVEEQVRNSLKPTTQTYNPFLVPRKPVRRLKPAESKPRTKQTGPLVSMMDMLPAEIVEDLKYKPPKRFKPSNASWVTKRLYKFLETKLEPKYDYKARVRAEKLVETIYNFTKDIKKHHVAPLQMVDALKFEMARLNIVTTHFDFYDFIENYLPREIRIKVNPDVVNNIPLPKEGVFADIIT